MNVVALLDKVIFHVYSRVKRLHVHSKSTPCDEKRLPKELNMEVQTEDEYYDPLLGDLDVEAITGADDEIGSPLDDPEELLHGCCNSTSHPGEKRGNAGNCH